MLLTADTVQVSSKVRSRGIVSGSLGAVLSVKKTPGRAGTHRTHTGHAKLEVRLPRKSSHLTCLFDLDFEKGSVESTHKVPTSHYHTKHCHAVVASLGGLTPARIFKDPAPTPRPGHATLSKANSKLSALSLRSGFLRARQRVDGAARDKREADPPTDVRRA
jgi:hypothetical protein